MTNTSISFDNTREFEHRLPNKETTSENYEVKKDIHRRVLSEDRTLEDILTETILTDSLALRRANRAISAQVSDEEYQKLMSQRNALVDKEYDVGLTDNERTKLEMLRWEIECIEDARYGKHFDELEQLILLKKNLAREIAYFVDEANYLKRKKERKKYGP